MGSWGSKKESAPLNRQNDFSFVPIGPPGTQIHKKLWICYTSGNMMISYIF